MRDHPRADELHRPRGNRSRMGESSVWVRLRLVMTSEALFLSSSFQSDQIVRPGISMQRVLIGPYGPWGRGRHLFTDHTKTKIESSLVW